MRYSGVALGFMDGGTREAADEAQRTCKRLSALEDAAASVPGRRTPEHGEEARGRGSGSEMEVAGEAAGAGGDEASTRRKKATGLGRHEDDADELHDHVNRRNLPVLEEIEAQ